MGTEPSWVSLRLQLLELPGIRGGCPGASVCRERCSGCKGGPGRGVSGSTRLEDSLCVSSAQHGTLGSGRSSDKGPSWSSRSLGARCRNSIASCPEEQPHVGNYRLLRTIGKGNFAKVKLARHILTGREVSVESQGRPASTTPIPTPGRGGWHRCVWHFSGGMGRPGHPMCEWWALAPRSLLETSRIGQPLSWTLTVAALVQKARSRRPHPRRRQVPLRLPHLTTSSGETAKGRLSSLGWPLRVPSHHAHHTHQRPQALAGAQADSEKAPDCMAVSHPAPRLGIRFGDTLVWPRGQHQTKS